MEQQGGGGGRPSHGFVRELDARQVPIPGYDAPVAVRSGVLSINGHIKDAAIARSYRVRRGDVVPGLVDSNSELAFLLEITVAAIDCSMTLLSNDAAR